ncbi:MAG: portal protein [Dehalococcoidales bacterium]|nr:portal protein [Dehalococcoidales bacterium]
MGFRESISKFFKRDKVAQIEKKGRGYSFDDPMGGAVDNAAGMTGMNMLTVALSMDQNLLERYADYENMDDYPELSAALDIFADDTTIPDSVRGKTIWGESPDRVVRDVIDDLLHRILRVEEDVWVVMRTLCKYGNAFGEVVVSEHGVVGVNYLPVPTMRRLVNMKGDLLGYVQDLTGQFGLDTADYETLEGLKARFEEKSMIFFEPWEIVHWRLQSKFVRSLYGYCLVGDSQVWTPTGTKRLDEVRQGDFVYTRHAGMLRSTKVLDQVCSGVKPVFRLKTTHREIRLTSEHPLLTKRGASNSWVQVKDLGKGDEIVAVTNSPETIGPPPLGIVLDEVTDETVVTFSSRGSAIVRSMTRPTKYASSYCGVRRVAKEVGISKGSLEDLLNGSGGIPLCTMRAFLRLLKLPWFDGICVKAGNRRLCLPDLVDEKFSRLFGFLLGDGWISGHQVCFALGEREERNAFYEQCLIDYGLSPQRVRGHGENAYRQVNCGSNDLIHVFSSLGWRGEKAHDKRVPSWMFSQSREIREAFLRGIMDADGWEASGYEHIELCNRDLVRDIKTLVDGLGWSSGNIRRRNPRNSEYKGKTIRSGPTYTLTFRNRELGNGDFVYEKIVSIERDGEEPVYDIQVADAGHCFVADGLVVHNSIIDASRWIWKRLAMLEDTALVYKLTRSPSRYAFYVDTGDLPPDEAMALVKKAMRRYKKRTLVNPTTGKLEFRNNPLCLTGDTKIPLLDGRVLPLSEVVAEFESGKKPWVYSCSVGKGGKLVPMPVTWAGKTRLNADLVRVTLDNGESIRVTPDHSFPTRDGRKVKAAELSIGESLMPFRRYIDKITRIDELDGKLNGYEKVYDPSDRKWKWTHRVVGEAVNMACPGQVVHHRDFNRRNNCPSNLDVLSPKEHQKVHKENGRTAGRAIAKLRKIDSVLDKKLRDAASRTMTEFNKTERQRKRTSERNKRLGTGRHIIEYNNSEKHSLDNRIRSDSAREMWSRNRLGLIDKFRLDFDETVWEWMKSICESNPSITFSEMLDRLNLEMRDHLLFINKDYRYAHHDVIASARVLKQRLSENGYRGLGGFKKSIFNNHKVVSIEYLEEKEDTYTLTVNGTHTFALDAGVFTFNSPEEDLWIPTRGGKESTRVDVLSGPDWQCLTGDTVIPLLDGSSRTLSDLSDNGDSVWLYSLNEKGEIVPGRGHSARRTKKAEVWEIELDNGEVVRCSDNHPFMLRDGTWARADGLVVGDSLMPLYRKISSIDDGERLDGYEQVYDPFTNEFQYTHQVVNRSRSGSLLPKPGSVIHHAGDNKLDNRPEVLIEMTRSDHSKLHLSLCDYLHSSKVKAAATAAKRTPDVRRKLREAWTDDRRKSLMLRNASVSKSARIRAGDRITAWNRSEERRLRRAFRYRKVTVEELASVVIDNNVQRIKDLYPLGYSQGLIERVLNDTGIGWCEFAKRHISGWVPRGRAVSVMNHRVVSVRRTGKEEWLYDLTVDEYHNFAVGQGVFVHNSMEDVQYFRDKMFTAIKIPQSYFGGEAEASQGLAQRDVRFGRTCMRVQREYRNGIRQVARVHLAALGIDPDSVKWDTRMTVPSSIFELQQIEVMNAQAGLISTLSEYFPQDWLLERVLHMSKDEAAAMVNQKASEVERTMSDQARVAATIQAKYPELAIPPEAAAMAMGELPMESREVSKKLDKLHEAVNKTIQTSSRVLKRVENMEPTMARTFLKLRQVK